VNRKLATMWGDLRRWLRRRRERVVLTLSACMLALAVGAGIVGSLHLHRAAVLERQQIRTQELQSAVLEGDNADVMAAYRAVGAHDAAEGARIRPLLFQYLRGRTNFSTLEQRIDAELGRLSRESKTLYPETRSWLILWASATGLLIVLLALQFELARRSGRIDRDHARRSEELAALRDSLVAVVSHELRTPLTSITGYLEMLEEDAGNLTPQQNAYLGIVRRGSERLMALVEELLLVVEADRGLLHVQDDVVDVPTLVDDTVESARPAADARTIVLRAEHGTSGAVVADHRRLSQLLDNLVSNAIKFTPDGGRVVVRSGRRDGQLVLEVTDTGDGIAAEDRERLFDPFFRAREATVNAVPGTGLGLTIAKAIVDAHHGALEVDSSGEGTTFRARIPLGGTNPPVPSF